MLFRSLCLEVNPRDNDPPVVDVSSPPVVDGSAPNASDQHAPIPEQPRWKSIIAAVAIDRYSKKLGGFRAPICAVLIHSILQWYWNTQSERMATWWECPHGAVQVHGPRNSKPMGSEHARCSRPECTQYAHASWLRHLHKSSGWPSPALFITMSDVRDEIGRAHV